MPLSTDDDDICQNFPKPEPPACDVGNRFWHIRLNKESSILTAFTTAFVHYRWLCMSMGISRALEVFQRRFSQVQEGVPWVKIIADDILTVGEPSNDT